MVSFLGVFLFDEGVCMAQRPSFYVRLRKQGADEGSLAACSEQNVLNGPFWA